MKKILKVVLNGMTLMLAQEATAMTTTRKKPVAVGIRVIPGTKQTVPPSTQAQAEIKRVQAQKQKESQSLLKAVTTPSQTPVLASKTPAPTQKVTREEALRIFGLNTIATDTEINERWLNLKDQNTALAKEAQKRLNLKGGKYLMAVNNAWMVLKPKN